MFLFYIIIDIKFHFRCLFKHPVHCVVVCNDFYSVLLFFELVKCFLKVLIKLLKAQVLS